MVLLNAVCLHPVSYGSLALVWWSTFFFFFFFFFLQERQPFATSCLLSCTPKTLQNWVQNITKTCLFKYSENFTTKKKISDKKSKVWYFSYFCSKHRLWYLLEPPQQGGYNEYPQSMFLSRNKKNNVYTCKSQFYYIKVGFKEVKII